MDKLFALIKVQLKTNFMSGMTYRSKKGKDLTVLTNVFAVIVVAIVFLPLVAQSVRFLHENLSLIGMQNLLIQAGIILGTLVIMMFTTLSVLETFYYSKDIEYLMPLPLKPTDLILSKFVVALVTQYVFLAMFYFPLMITFGILESLGILYYLAFTLLFFLIPIFPTVLLVVLLMIFMRITSFAKNRDIVRAVFFFFIFIVSSIGGAIIGAGATMENFDLQSFMNNPLMQAITFILTPVTMAIEVILYPTSNWLSLIFFLLITLASVFVFVSFGKWLYLPTIIGFGASSSKKESIGQKDLDNIEIKKSGVKLLISGEFKNIIRTPMFALNCFLLPLLMPLVMVIAAVFGGGGLDDLTEALGYLRELGFIDNNAVASTIGIVFAILYFMTSYNTTAMSSFSREGKTINTWKYLPITLEKIVASKLIVAILSNIIPMLFTLFGIIFLLHLPIWQAIILFLFMVGSLIFTSLLFLIFDMMSPRLNWDNEQQAVKGGLTQGLLAIINMIIAVAIGVAGWFIPSIFGIVIIGLLFPVLGFLLLILVLKKKSQTWWGKMG